MGGQRRVPGRAARALQSLRAPARLRRGTRSAWPLLTRLAARDRAGRPCTARLGLGGCGHYVKMVHNGIEHGMMTALCEVWGIMMGGLGWSHDEVAAVLGRWDTDADSMLRHNFLVGIGAEICRARDPKDVNKFVLDDIRDKVVQDVCEEEGTGTWTVEEAARLHVACPSIAASHIFRVQSAYASRREAAHDAFREAGTGTGVVAPPAASPAQAQAQAQKTAEGKLQAARWLRDATCASFLLCYIQGMHLIAAADDEHGWGLDYADVMQLWRGGCIIQSDAIVDMLEGVYKSGKADKHNLLAHPTIAGELSPLMPSFRDLVIRAVTWDAYTPCLSASLEYLKYSVSTDLPTSFQEAQLDFFGNHMYDLKSEGPGEPVVGKHHHEWRPARGLKEMEEALKKEEQEEH